MSDNNTFEYSYSSKEQEELKRIRAKYTPPTKEEDKLERLFRLDASVHKSAQTVAIILGVLGTLILGAGMSLIMSDFSSILGEYRDMAIVIGLIVGFLGIAVIILAYPAYNLIVKRKRKQLAPEIIRLADELMK